MRNVSKLSQFMHGVRKIISFKSFSLLDKRMIFICFALYKHTVHIQIGLQTQSLDLRERDSPDKDVPVTSSEKFSEKVKSCVWYLTAGVT